MKEKMAEIETGSHRLIIVTGLSGAGKSSVLNALEDIGYQGIDNLPLTLLSDLLDEELASEDTRPLAVGIDSRTLHFSPKAFEESLARTKERPEIDLHVLFLDADDATLVKRFSETRRMHPFANGRLLRDAISQERDLMAAIRPMVDSFMDTSLLKSADTRRLVHTRFADSAAHSGLVLTFMSFGFSSGIPRDADLVFDVRFLRNPHYVPELQSHTGQEEMVANYVRADEAFTPFVQKIVDLLIFLLPRYKDEGKSYLTIAFGCTGGKHRSVMMAETMADLAKVKMKLDDSVINLYHRDITDQKIREETGI